MGGLRAFFSLKLHSIPSFPQKHSNPINMRQSSQLYPKFQSYAYGFNNQAINNCPNNVLKRKLYRIHHSIPEKV
nr:hypothetical protein Iba_chr03bCG14370 [Ipomoea batatas]